MAQINSVLNNAKTKQVIAPRFSKVCQYFDILTLESFEVFEIYNVKIQGGRLNS